MSSRNDNYHIHIDGSSMPIALNLKELWRYRDLIMLFTRRTMTLMYKQTVLGPLWLIIMPLFTSVVYAAVFKGIAGISTDGVPALPFYLCSHSLWKFFSSCLKRNSTTFVDNANIFGKVYFPRLAISVSTMLTSLIEFLIELALITIVLAVYTVRGEAHPNAGILWLLPVVILMVGVLGMGLGILVSSLTTKYRDLVMLVDFGVSLWMYATPVVYPMSQLTNTGLLQQLMLFNPMTAPMELFRMIMLSAGNVSAVSIASSIIFTFAALAAGVIVFNRVERTFIDTI